MYSDKQKLESQNIDEHAKNSRRIENRIEVEEGLLSSRDNTKSLIVSQSDEHWQEGEDVEGIFVIKQILQHLAAKHGLNVDQVMYREQKRCPTCQMTLRDIAHVGKFGCHDCYQTFKDDVYDIVRRVQGGHTEHSGKCPKSSQHKRALKKQIEEKRARLETLVSQQEFEQAAVVRDEIKALEQQSKELTQDD
ncbi:UvrB/UvrC motif-containing protein [Staphylococcus canis]|uniref:Excinuclease ABC subunit B n=1 Tax=Staphylococcus canis TaxID=2724942 RepID=A0ABS0TA82_9STAP|nr:UvrB/UvrC motif-containing protein [Staphylococcus canis]MBI5975632.1 excinuclease ABC subunit B [Staphylococcus canis]